MTAPPDARPPRPAGEPPASGTGRPRPAVRDDLALFGGYHSPQVDVAVRLNTNEAPVPPPVAWRQMLAEELDGVAWHRYPDRRAWALRRALAAHHGVAPEQVFCANGSNEVLQSLCLAYGGPGRRALTFEPTYALHAHIARLTGTAVVEAERRDDFSLDPVEAAAAVRAHDPALVFLCSPNNPTGRAETPEVLDAVAGVAAGVVVVDEAYGQFSDWSALDRVDDETPLVVVRTFSKTWSMAAARLGYLVGPAWLVAELERVALPYHLDAVKQAGGRLALRFEAEMRARVAELVGERERVEAALAALDVDVWPSSANFVLFRPRRRSGDEVWAALVERSVLVRNCSSWPRLAGCLRVTVGTPAENSAFLSALEEVLR